MTRDKVSKPPIAVAIPTYGRERVLLDTLMHVMALDPPPAEILVVDQTKQHEPETARQLRLWNDVGTIRWLRRERPSIPMAMNYALQMAEQPFVLFLDDDIIPSRDLLAHHLTCYTDLTVTAVVGQVLQPGEEPAANHTQRRGRGIWEDLEFAFYSDQSCEVHNVMAGNLSVRRHLAISAGGFDENFVRVAYRFETEFCRRVWAAGGKVSYQPAASIRHLRVARGGTRSYGNHLTTLKPHHAVGDYYFALRNGFRLETLAYAISRIQKSLVTRYYLRRPWVLPVRIISETSGFIWALWLIAWGPKYISEDAPTTLR